MTSSVGEVLSSGDAGQQAQKLRGIRLLVWALTLWLSLALSGCSSGSGGGNTSGSSASPALSDVDLALGKSYTVHDPWLDPEWVQNEQAHPDTNRTMLTDGISGSTTMANFVGYLRDDYRDIDIDLGQRETVHSVTAGFLQNVGSGIFFPEAVTFSLSSDGTNWASVGEAATQIPLDTASSNGNSSIYQTFTLSGFNYAARFVRVHFQTHVWVFCDEVQVLGLTTVAPTASSPAATPLVYTPALGFPKPGSATGGASQQALVYNGYTADNSSTWTAADFKPYVTYVDTNGNSQSMLFDSFLFLPEGAAPSGNKFGAAGTPSNQADWQYYLDNTFDPADQLAALNAAVANAHTALNNTLTPAVVIAIPYPSPKQTQFSTGVSFNQTQVGDSTSLQNRLNAIKWYVNQVLQNWNTAGYSDLKFTGFYWYDENVEYGLSPIEVQLIQQTAAYIHSLGYKFYWIPDYQGQGFQIWQQLGFDVVNMQPNYYFAPSTVPAQRLDVAAAIAKQYGMGIEMEMDDNILNNTTTAASYRDKVQSYFSYGSSDGYKGTFSNWYQGIKTLEKASQSTDTAVRGIYDAAEQWMIPTYR